MKAAPETTIPTEEYLRLTQIEADVRLVVATAVTAAPVPLSGYAGPSPAEYLAARARLGLLTAGPSPSPPDPAGEPTLEVTLEYQWSANTAVPPTGSQMRFNAATPEETTRVAMRYRTSDGNELGSALHRIAAGEPLEVRDTGDAQRWAEFEVAGPVLDFPEDEYVQVPVTFTRKYGTLRAHEVFVTLHVAPAASTSD